jgi:hydroxymethylglutaryl-CoA reductase
MSVGLVGGIINVHPTAKVCAKILQINTASELACVLVAVGLAQNLSAIRALASEGIQKGHMKLHARNIAAAAGAEPEQIDSIAEKMVKEGKISINRARELVGS